MTSQMRRRAVVSLPGSYPGGRRFESARRHQFPRPSQRPPQKRQIRRTEHARNSGHGRGNGLTPMSVLLPPSEQSDRRILAPPPSGYCCYPRSRPGNAGNLFIEVIDAKPL